MNLLSSEPSPKQASFNKYSFKLFTEFWRWFVNNCREEYVRKHLEYEQLDSKVRDPFYDRHEEERREKERKRMSELRTDKDGNPLNINQAKIDFHYDDSDPDNIVVELQLYKVTAKRKRH